MALSSQPVSSATQSRRAAGGKDASLHQFFSPGGVLAGTHPAYEFRRGQLQMAQAVEQALEEKRHLIVEAGTGTGKTLAYLMPVIRSGKRVIISTGTKNLQEQLFYKDVPFLEQALFGEAASGDEFEPAPFGLLHERPQQLFVPQEALRPHRPARAQRVGRDRAISRDRSVGENDLHRRSRGTR